MLIKLRLRTKLLLVFLAIVAFNTLAINLLGTRYIESYYKYEKEVEIENVARTIIQMSQTQTNERRPWYTYVLSQENNYYSFLIFDYEDSKPSVLYYTNSSGENSKSYQYWINEAISHNVFITFNSNPDAILALESNDNLNIYCKLSENQYLFIATPLQYIETTSQLALRFFTYISVASMAIAAILVFIVSNQISKPIRKISTIATKISNMQFDEHCQVRGNDEVADLAKNINIMSNKIEENVNILIEKNELLQKDLDNQEETARLRRQFISNVSHDFKTPLALIQAYGEVLEEDENTDKETKETLDLIIGQARNMNVLVNELLSLNQLESGLIQLEKSIFPIDDVILDIVHQLSILMKEKNLTYTYTKDNEYIVNADYQRIHQVIQNLIENAVKYTPEGGEFSINVKHSYDQVEVAISNVAGKDIDDEVLAHLFDSFYMKDTVRNATLKSYGLGLAIVKATMDLHEQQCGVRLEDGIITFYITLEVYQLMDDDDDWDDDEVESESEN